MNLPPGVKRQNRIGGETDDARELDEELTFHFEEMIRELRARGLDREQAEWEARRRFGNERSYRREIERIDRGRTREVRMSMGMEIAVSHLVMALRRIRRAPGFASAVVLILALGIGANAVMFGVVNRLLLSPPRYIADAQNVRRLYRWSTSVFRPNEFAYGQFMSYPDYVDLKSVKAFQSVGAVFNRTLVLGREENAEQVSTGLVTASFFPVLGVQPERGRFFTETEAAVGGDPTVVLSHELWVRRFGGDPGILGRSLDIGAGTYTVIGIAPPGFTGIDLQKVDLWLPLETAMSVDWSPRPWRDVRGFLFLQAVARLAPGATDETATAQATAAHRGGRADLIAAGRYAPESKIETASIIEARGPMASKEAKVAWWLAGVSLIVLFIACFNVANLLLVRALRLRREAAVRTALGGGWGRVLGQHLTESLVLTGLGAVVAFVLARWGGGSLQRALLPDVAFNDQGAGGRLVLFFVAATVVAALLPGVLPALQTRRTDPASALKVGGRTGAHGRSRVRVGLLVAQAVLSVVLLVGSGLFVRSLREASRQDLGFDADHLAIVRMRWNGAPSPEEQSQAFRDAREAVLRLPGVRGASPSMTFPFLAVRALGNPRVPGLDSVPPHPTGNPYFMNAVGTGFFDAMGLAILQGRPILASDEGPGASPVAVVSQAMATAVWPDRSPLGECMYLGGGDISALPCTEVVGVVEDYNLLRLEEPTPYYTYILNLGHPAAAGSPQFLVVRRTGDALPALRDVQEAARGTSAIIRFADIQDFRSVIEPQVRSWRLGATLFTLFGLLALLVAACGLYSTLAFDVALRRTELGIRSALGADPGQLLRGVLTRAVILTSAGLLLGLGIALAASRYLTPLLYHVSARDPGVYLGVAAVLLVVAGAAGFLPAWRASRLNPTEALRAE